MLGTEPSTGSRSVKPSNTLSVPHTGSDGTPSIVIGPWTGTARTRRDSPPGSSARPAGAVPALAACTSGAPAGGLAGGAPGEGSAGGGGGGKGGGRGRTAGGPGADTGEGGGSGGGTK